MSPDAPRGEPRTGFLSATRINLMALVRRALRHSYFFWGCWCVVVFCANCGLAYAVWPHPAAVIYSFSAGVATVVALACLFPNKIPYVVEPPTDEQRAEMAQHLQYMVHASMVRAGFKKPLDGSDDHTSVH